MRTAADHDTRLRDMTSGDLPAMHALSRLVQWSHRQEDWDLMFKVGLGVVAERDGQVVGAAMGWPHGPAAATLGMVIVAPGARGGGIGRKLMNAVMAQLGERTILLNATEEGLPLYKSLGFKAVGGVHQHQGAAFKVPMIKLRAHERVRPMGAGDEAAIVELDRGASGLARGRMFAQLLGAAQGVVLDRDNEAVGFALFRRFGHGYLIGPVVAPDAHGAKILISHWLGSNPGMFTRIDAPYDSGLSTWLGDLGLAAVDRVTTMAFGEPPARTAAAATFAIASQALG
ncbi:MAG TPA: GNAT family N-acetyltransferase [Caulobacteraceae bacterium]